MITQTTKRSYQDSLFRFIFGRKEHKPWLLELYNALNDSHYDNVDDLTLTTIEDVVYIKMKNDISFLIDSQMNLFEHQSTYNPNMPLRGFFYFSQLYQEYLVNHEISLFSSSTRKIPTPQYVVFYTGDRELPDRSEMKLSDAFEVPREDTAFEWTCTVVNLNPGHNESLNKNCKPLYDYSRFVERVKQNREKGMALETSVNEAVEKAIEWDLLDGLFKKERSQIMGFYLAEFNEEAYKKGIYEDGFDDGVAEGITQGITQGVTQGIAQGKLETARSLLRMKVGTIPQIAQATGLSEEQVQELHKEVQTLV